MEQIPSMARVLRSQRAGLRVKAAGGINGTRTVPYEMGHWVQAHSCRPRQVKVPHMPSLYPSVEGRIMASQRCPHPNSQNLWVGYTTWQRLIKDKEGIRVVNQVILKYRDCPGLSGLPQCNYKGSNRGIERQKSRCRGGVAGEGLTWLSLTLNVERATGGQKRAALCSWEKQGSESSLKSSRKKCSPITTPILA